jgi:isocitrate lyase
MPIGKRVVQVVKLRNQLDTLMRTTQVKAEKIERTMGSLEKDDLFVRSFGEIF